MIQICVGVLVAGLLAFSGSVEASVERSPVSFRAADGVVVYADFYRQRSPGTRPIILLFHQALSNAAEYETIAPRLVDAGFDCLSVDQRSGGSKWGRNNRTVQALGRSTMFPHAYADLVAAFHWAEHNRSGAPIIVWGSSYSAALVFRLAKEQPGVAAVLAFSPGEHLGAGDPVRAWAQQIRSPLLVASIAGSEAVDADGIFALVASETKVRYVPARGGAHGSSMLRRDRNPTGADEAWTVVLRFLRAVASDD